MANFYSKGRTNYFTVRDRDAFEAWCAEHGVTLIEDGERVGFMTDQQDAGFPLDLYDEEQDDYVETDPTGDLASMLAEGEVAVYEEVGSEKFRYFVAFAWAVNWRGEVARWHMDGIYDQAAALLGPEKSGLTHARG